MKSNGNQIEQKIVAKALEQGASLAGIASVEDLKKSRSFEIYDKKPYYDDYKGVEWNPEHKSVLVWALAHPTSEPKLDWWSFKIPGFTPGNRVLRKQSRRMRIWLGEELGIKALSLPYQIEFGGTFLKDSAVLAGLGVIGKHNILVTPEFGSDLRLRGIFMEADLEATGPITDFDPCNGCDMPCHSACPRGGLPLSVCRTSGCTKHPSASTACRIRAATRSALLRPCTSQPTILRLKMSTIK